MRTYYEKRRANFTPEQIKEQNRKDSERAKRSRKLRASIGCLPVRRKKTVEERQIDLGHRASRLLASAKSRSVNAVDFNITQKWIMLKLRTGICERSGVTFDFSKPVDTYRNPFGPSIDRIDNFKGYTLANTQVVCNMYNTGKGQHSDEQFIEFCRKVVEFNS